MAAWFRQSFNAATNRGTPSIHPGHSWPLLRLPRGRPSCSDLPRSTTLLPLQALWAQRTAVPNQSTPNLASGETGGLPSTTSTTTAASDATSPAAVATSCFCANGGRGPRHPFRKKSPSLCPAPLTWRAMLGTGNVARLCPRP